MNDLPSITGFSSRSFLAASSVTTRGNFAGEMTGVVTGDVMGVAGGF